MNKLRRKAIRKLVNRLNKVLQELNEDNIDYIEGLISDITDDVQDIFDEEDECRENTPENLQNSYRYQVCEDACDNLEYAIEYLEDIDYENMDNIIESVNNAIESLDNASA